LGGSSPRDETFATPEPAVHVCWMLADITNSQPSKARTENAAQCLPAVTAGKSSVRKGVSGRPTAEYMLQTGLSAQA